MAESPYLVRVLDMSEGMREKAVDADDVFGVPVTTGDWTFANGSAFRQTLTANLTADHDIQLPDSDGTMAILELAQSWTAAQTYGSDILRATAPRITTSLLDTNGVELLRVTPTVGATRMLELGNGAILGSFLRPVLSDTGRLGDATHVFSSVHAINHTVYNGALTFSTNIVTAATGSDKTATLPNATGNIAMDSIDNNFSVDQTFGVDINLVGSLYPTVDNSSDIGDATHQISSLYLATSVESDDDLEINMTGAGNLALTVSNPGAGDANIVADKGYIDAFDNVKIGGRTAFRFSLTGTPTANRTITLRDVAASTVAMGTPQADIPAPTAPGAAYDQTEAQSAVAAINAILAALDAYGITL